MQHWLLLACETNLPGLLCVDYFFVAQRALLSAVTITICTSFLVIALIAYYTRRLPLCLFFASLVTKVYHVSVALALYARPHPPKISKSSINSFTTPSAAWQNARLGSIPMSSNPVDLNSAREEKGEYEEFAV